MEGNGGPEQPTPQNPLTAEQIHTQARDAAQDWRNRSPATANLAGMIEDQSTIPPVAPTFNEYGKLAKPNTSQQPEIRATAPEIQNKEEDYGSSREDFNSKLASAAALADAIATLGDKEGAKQVLDATLGGKLAGLDNPPDITELQRLTDKAMWGKLPMVTKIAIALTSK